MGTSIKEPILKKQYIYNMYIENYIIPERTSPREIPPAIPAEGCC